MLIYFAGSIRAGRSDAQLYYKLVEVLKKYGTVLTEHVGNLNLTSAGEQMSEKDIHDRDVHMLQQSDEIWEKSILLSYRITHYNISELYQTDYDPSLCISIVLVAEVTQPSLGVGYEIGRAVAMKKKILCLFRPESGRNLSAMVQGAHNGNSFIVKHYKETEVEQILQEYFMS